MVNVLAYKKLPRAYTPKSLCVLASLLLPLATQAANAAPDDKVEPPAEYVLQSGKKQIPVTLGKEFALPAGTAQGRMKLSLKPTRTFHKAGIKFQYPTTYSFEADTSEQPLTVWTLQGINTLLMLQKYPNLPVATLSQQISSGLVQQYGAANVKSTPSSITLGGRKVAGTRLLVLTLEQNWCKRCIFSPQPKAHLC